MKRKTVLLFSGQGSQYYQMGRSLYEQNPVFRASMDRLDRLAQAMLGRSVVQALYGAHGKGEPFDDIGLTHPAIFMVEVALAETIVDLGVRPDCTLGASLGTFAALVLAGCLSAEDGLGLVIRQALAIEADCPGGGMIAVLGSPELYERSPFLQARAQLAGQNFASHFVLSAPRDNLAAIQSFLARQGVAQQALPVHYPFHSIWIDPLRERLGQACASGAIRLGDTPVWCCASGGVLRDIPGDYFWRVARDDIGFMRTIALLEQAGPFDYVDAGPSGTLATFLKYLLPPGSASRSFSLMSPYGSDAESLAAAAAQLLVARVGA